ncbi:PP2C family protein-serine/threonine phosphatase [Cellulomonas cellasea]|uniref:Membrane protein n=1 Tax=Cellulomonas cellasea TaxID=43670 RepID=A0A4Y3KWY9_9CELL|nr:PP2C family protein-serine/threonine phosphatase [Cellulomonas cellasea]GEA87755.1 membrane protein [Cellulomonas cellasea]
MSGSRGGRILRAFGLPCLLVATILGADTLEGPKTAFVGVLAVTPMLAAVFGGPTAVVAVGLVALTSGWLFGLHAHDGQVAAQQVRLAVIAVMTLLAAVAAAERVRRETTLDRLTLVTLAVSEAVIRPLPDNLRGVAIAARYTGVEAQAHVGGDVYEVLSTAYGVRAVLGDVRGKGLSAVRLANYVLGAFREAARREESLVDVVRAMEALVRAEGGDEDFVTAVVVEVAHDGVVTAICCGHPVPVLLTADGPRPADVVPDLPLGLGAGAVGAGRLADGPAGVLLFSDGLTEARDRGGRFLDVDEVLRRHAGVSGADLVDALQRTVTAHTDGELRDDVTLLWLGVPAGPLTGEAPQSPAEPVAHRPSPHG